MDQFFDNFYNYAGFGPAISQDFPTDSFCKKITGKLPDQLVNYWREYGFSGWGDGLFWIVNPEEYESVLNAWLEGTSFEEQDDYYVIARTAFGRLYVWGKNSGACIQINTIWGMLFPNDQTEKMKERGADKMVQGFIASRLKKSCDITNESDHPMFERAKIELGLLANDEMYAFVPALALGGRAELKNLKKVKVLEHLAFLADLGEKRIMKDINKELGPVS